MKSGIYGLDYVTFPQVTISPDGMIVERGKKGEPDYHVEHIWPQAYHIKLHDNRIISLDDLINAYEEI